MSIPKIENISPFFIVSDISQSIAFYHDKLGFEIEHHDPNQTPFFAIVRRDNAMLFLKSGKAQPQPNTAHDPDMRWDAYLSTSDPDALATDLTQRGAPFSRPLHDTHEGLRGFEIADPDGYILFFGRPR